MSCNLQESSFYVLSGCSAGVARFVRDEEVVGSNPATPTINDPGTVYYVGEGSKIGDGKITRVV